MTSSVNVPLYNLRAIVILIVVAFHSALPYLASQPLEPFAFDAEPYLWIAFPIIDHERWFGFDLFCAWQDISLMPLMFFLAGLFAPASLARKGPLAYLADRWWRIGLPFVLAVTVLSPLAYFASFCLTTADRSLEAFWQHWRALPMWPSGPQWFLWQVFVLSALSAALYGLAPRWREALSRLAERLGNRPLGFFAWLTGLSLIAYVPLALALSPWDWTNVGPFSVQQCRPLLYLLYFFAGFSVGGVGDQGLLRIEGPIARHWLAFCGAAMICFIAWGMLTSLTLPDWNGSPLRYRSAAAFTFPFACASGVVAYLALALRFLRGRDRVLDQLSNHAYGIYLVHYVFVLWLQYVLVGTPMNAPAKMLLVFAIAMALSWAASAGAAAVVAAIVGKPARGPSRRTVAVPQFASEVAMDRELRNRSSG